MTMTAVLHIDQETLKALPAFSKGVDWFVNYRRKHNKYEVIEKYEEDEEFILSLVPRKRMERLLLALLDEREFLSPYGIRALSKIHQNPYSIVIGGTEFSVKYAPAESETTLFGGNSNWRGPIWIPMNFLFVESLKEFHSYYKDSFKVDCPDGSGKRFNLSELSDILNKRIVSMFKKDKEGNRPIHQLHQEIYRDPHFKDLLLFYE